MNGLLGLAADFLDRVANPAHGPAVNEAYGHRLEELLEGDDHLASTLMNLDLEHGDVGTLSVDGWMWYLPWRARRARLPSDEFLDALYDRTPEPIVRLRILASVVSHPDIIETIRVDHRAQPIPISELRPSWLQHRLQLAVARFDRHGNDHQVDVDPGAALELALYLLQLGDQVSIEALRSLIAEPSASQLAIAEVVGQTLLAAELDEDTLGEWRSHLGLDRL